MLMAALMQTGVTEEEVAGRHAHTTMYRDDINCPASYKGTYGELSLTKSRVRYRATTGKTTKFSFQSIKSIDMVLHPDTNEPAVSIKDSSTSEERIFTFTSNTAQQDRQLLVSEIRKRMAKPSLGQQKALTKKKKQPRDTKKVATDAQVAIPRTEPEIRAYILVTDPMLKYVYSALVPKTIPDKHFWNVGNRKEMLAQGLNKEVTDQHVGLPSSMSIEVITNKQHEIILNEWIKRDLFLHFPFVQEMYQRLVESRKMDEMKFWELYFESPFFKDNRIESIGLGTQHQRSYRREEITEENSAKLEAQTLYENTEKEVKEHLENSQADLVAISGRKRLREVDPMVNLSREFEDNCDIPEELYTASKSLPENEYINRFERLVEFLYKHSDVVLKPNEMKQLISVEDSTAEIRKLAVEVTPRTSVDNAKVDNVDFAENWVDTELNLDELIVINEGEKLTERSTGLYQDNRFEAFQKSCLEDGSTIKSLRIFSESRPVNLSSSTMTTIVQLEVICLELAQYLWSLETSESPELLKELDRIKRSLSLFQNLLETELDRDLTGATAFSHVRSMLEASFRLCNERISCFRHKKRKQ